MTIRSWTATTLLTIALIAGLHINSQAQDTHTSNSWIYGATSDSQPTGTVRFSIDAPDIQEFLNDPVSKVRQKGIELTSTQEAAWRQLTVALRRLANPHLSRASGNRRPGNEVVYFKITMTQAVMVPGRGWSGVVKAGGPQRFDRNALLSDPVGTLKSYGVDVPKADEGAWQQLASAIKVLRDSSRSTSSPRQSTGQSEVTTGQPTQEAGRRMVEGHSAEFYAGNRIENAARKSDTRRLKAKSPDSEDPQAGTTEVAVETEEETDDPESGSKKAAESQPDLVISKFLFPPTANKKLRVQIVNSGPAASEACRLIITVRNINGISAGRKTHVNVPSLPAGESVWLLLDAAGILPVNVSLESTTFKLNVDGTGLIAESDESNNEVWHNL